MRINKPTITAALAVPMLALGGGIAYANTVGTPGPARPAVTTTVQAPRHNPAGQANRYRCDWQCGNHRPEHATQRPLTRRPATQRHSYPASHGYQGRTGWGYQRGHRGNGCCW
jgi:hypothetical protein